MMGQFPLLFSVYFFPHIIPRDHSARTFPANITASSYLSSVRRGDGLLQVLSFLQTGLKETIKAFEGARGARRSAPR